MCDVCVLRDVFIHRAPSGSQAAGDQSTEEDDCHRGSQSPLPSVSGSG